MSAINLNLKYGTLANMPSSISNGTLNVATDVQKAFVDVNGIRVALGDVVTSYTEQQITAIAKANALPKLYLSSDSMLLFYFDANAGEEDPETHVKPGAWVQVGGSVSHADRADKDGSGNVITTTYKTIASATEDYNTLVGMINQINSFDVQLVASFAELPVEGNSHTIYFVPANPIETDPDRNIYDEYMWVVKTPASGDDPAVYGYEHIGTTETDLTNYYTKTETDSIESAIYTALGVTKTEAADAGYTDFDTRVSTLESTAGTDGGRITELEAKFGAFNDSTDQGFTTVEARFTSDEADITEINAKLGNMAASTDPDFVSVEDRLSAIESDTTDSTDITEINAKLGNYLASTDPNFVSVEDRFSDAEGRLTTAEGDIDTAESDIDELQAQVGSYPASTSQDFVSIADRFTTNEADITELEAKFGAYADSTDSGFETVEARFTADETDISALQTEVGAASNPDAASLRGRMATAESDIDTAQADITEINAKLGNMAASTDSGFQSVETRLSTLENDTADATAVAEINAKLGNYLASTDPNFVSVEDRFTTNEADIDELEAKFGAYADSTDSGFETVEARFTSVEGRVTTAEGDIDALETEVGAASNPAASSLRGRMATAESDIDELQAQLGSDYPASTAQGFSSVSSRLTTLESAVGNINRFEVQVVQTLPQEGVPYTLYFVPQNAIPTNPDSNVFDEYMWVIKTPASGDDPAVWGFEHIGTTETDLTNYYTKSEIDAVVGDASTSGTLVYRIKTNEDAIAELEAKFGAYADSTDVGFETVEARFTSVEGRVTTTEGDITEINAKLGNMADSTDAGFESVEARLSAIEGGAVTQTEDDDDAEKPMLVSGDSNHSTVEYVPNVTVNAETGGITANQIVLGAATLTYDAVTGALVVNY